MNASSGVNGSDSCFARSSASTLKSIDEFSEKRIKEKDW